MRVTSQKLRDTKGELQNLNGAFKQQIEQFSSAYEVLFSKWQGDAKEEQKKAYLNDKQLFEAFYNMINEYCESLERQAQRYDQKEAENVQQAQTRNYH